METLHNSFGRILNIAHIYESKKKVILTNLHPSRNLSFITTFDTYEITNLSEIVYPKKLKNLNGTQLNVISSLFYNVIYTKDKVHSKWSYYLDILAEKMNVNLNFIRLPLKTETEISKELIRDHKLDFHINGFVTYGILSSYSNIKSCFVVPLPPKYSIYELVLILPLETSCWMWLGITVVICAFIWAIFEGFGMMGRFLFGMFSLFVGQYNEIKT